MSIRNSKLNFLDTVQKPSNSQVRKAGEVFRNPNATEQERDNAFNVMNQWRVLHEVPLNTFQATLRARLKHNDLKDAIVAQRLKRASTIIDKLSRESGMSLERMHDIGGLRVILKSVQEVRKVEKIYLEGNKFFKHQLIKEPYDYIKEPKKNSGYRGVHLVYKAKYDKEDWEQYSDLRIELQLRTEIQHIWATTIETASIFQKQDFKSSKGDENWLEFFKLVSSAFAIEEGTSVFHEHQNLSEQQIKDKIKQLSTELKVVETLNAYTISTKAITENKLGKATHYCLVILNIGEKSLSVSYYPKNLLSTAAKLLAEKEKEAENQNKPILPLLVSVNDVKKLPKAYPNYYLDTSNFIARLKEIIK